MKKVLFIETLSPDLMEILSSQSPHDMDLLTITSGTEQEIDNKLSIADALLVGPTKITKEIIKKAGRLRIIQKTGVGVENIDLTAAKDAGVAVSIASGANTIAVAEHIILLILSVYKKLPLIHGDLINGKWDKWKFRTVSSEICNKTVGIIGMGNIGRYLSSILNAFGARVVYHDVIKLSSVDESVLGLVYKPTIEEILKESDILSLNVPLTEKTRGLIGAYELGLMKKNAILINAARGGIVDEEALYNALRDGIIAGAGLDTYEKEPPGDIPLFKLDNIVVTPHNAAGTKEAMTRVYKESFNKISQFFDLSQNP